MKLKIPDNLFRLSQFFSEKSIVRDGNFSHLNQANTDAEGSLVYCANLNFLNQAIQNPNVSAIITTPLLAEMASSLACVITKTPRLDYYRLYKQLQRQGLLSPVMEFGRGNLCQIHPTAVISPKSFIGDNVVIEANAVIGDYVILGNGSYVGAGAIIGTNGLMPIWDEDGTAITLTHAGSIVIGSNSTILANSVIVRSIFPQPTTVGNNTYIGALTNIGHDAYIGHKCLIAGNCVIAGGSIIEDGVKIWASSSITHGCNLAQDAEVKIGSVVIHDLKAGEVVSGNFAYNHRQHTTNYIRKYQ
jgi:acyl-[acyl carrier protein]--UDP-N-acetylglucosamine O-acyltransferase